MNKNATITQKVCAESNEQIGAEITLLAGQINAANYRLLKLIARFDDSKGWSGGGTVKFCAHWLNWKCGIAMGAASHVEQLVSKYKRVKKSMEGKAEQEHQEGRELVYYQNAAGMWVISARLPPEAGSLLVKVIEALIKPVMEEKRSQLLEKKRQEKENVSAETFSDTVDAADPNHYFELIQHTRADALVTLAEHFLATSDENAQLKGLKGSERCQVLLHVDINTLREQPGNEGRGKQYCHLDEKPWVSAETARRLSCDAALTTVLEGEGGNVLNIGRRARTIPASIRRALDVRDKSCRFPGCCESRHVEGHHIEHWADGGETSLDNLLKLCRFHHAQLHRGCYGVRVETLENEPMLVFSTPSGRRIEESFFPQFSSEVVATAAEKLALSAPNVEVNTCVTQWRGERLDYGMAVEGML